MWITRTSIRNPVFATMVMIAITVLGVSSYQRLKVEQMPDVSLPFVQIMTSYPGAAPEAVEADVTKPIEYAVNQVSGVKRIFSNSREGRSDVFAEFRLWTDVNGRVTRQILIQIKPNALMALGIGVDQVINAIRNANQDVPAGRITKG